MAGSRKRAPSTPKKTPKRQKTTKKSRAKHLPGGALEMSFQLDVPSTAAQASTASQHVHFDLGTTSVASGAPRQGPPRPSQQNLEGEDPFAGSSPAQASNQGGLSSPQPENFDIGNVSDGSREGGASLRGSSDPPTPTRPSRRAQKAGSRLGSGDDTLRFFQVVEGKKQCKFCLVLHQEDASIKVHSYRPTTATGPLRAHLLKHHAEEWVAECQSLKIGLRGKEGEEAIARVTGVPVERQAERRTPFTQDNFLDGLVQFIVATDQVFFFFYFFSLFNFFFKGCDDCRQTRVPPPVSSTPP
ncbi:hypothetical protein EDB89DRAFT_1183790 [Lactarius sanguifluus]|nr:hypothetical protein EDB89DRAFT_1183790 [Lactarius sanguifluus]